MLHSRLNERIELYTAQRRICLDKEHWRKKTTYWGWNQGRFLRENLSDPGPMDGWALDEDKRRNGIVNKRKESLTNLNPEPLWSWPYILLTASGLGHTHQWGKDHQFYLHQLQPVSTSSCSHWSPCNTPHSHVFIHASFYSSSRGSRSPHQSCLLWPLLSNFAIPASYSLPHHPKIKKKKK